ncbi:MAG: polysaccharide deacetylase family protein, partial [Actinobacteria bacterium]|nr:polysaccharide deacetylase family protein [Actinomycetota bacterium]
PVYRLLLIIIAAVVVASPGAFSVISNAAATPASLASSPIASPSPSPGDADAPVTIATGVDDRWHRDEVVVDFNATDPVSGIAYTLFKVDDGAWTKGTRIEVQAPKNHSNDGAHVIRFYSVDNAQNAESEKSVTVKIDTTPPRFEWRDVSPGVIERVQAVSFRFTVHDIAFMPGLYRVGFTLTDQAGNVTTTGTRAFRNYRPAPAKAWRHVSGAGRRVALTFDDGGAGPWASMLNTLKAYHAHATFFPLGPYVGASPALARKTLAEGNAIGTHGWTHTDMTRQSYGAVRGEWTRTEAPWWNAAGATPVPYCRPPYGAYNGSTVAASGSAGFTRVILWDVDPQDWSEPGSGVIAQRVLSHVHSGAIVVMHLRGQTAAALPAILSGLRARGYKAVSLPELFRAAGYR